MVENCKILTLYELDETIKKNWGSFQKKNPSYKKIMICEKKIAVCNEKFQLRIK